MARYQLRRPSPVKIYSRLTRRQDGTATTMPLTEEEKEKEEGPESPDSPFSSPSTVGELSESEDSESEDEAEPPSPSESSVPQPIQTLGPDSTSAPPPPTLTSSPSLSSSSSESSTSSTSLPSFQFTSSTAVVAIPLTTGTTLMTTTSLPAATSTPASKSQSDRQKQASPTLSVSLPPPPPPPLSTAAAELSGETGASEMVRKPEATIMTKQAMIAAIVLGILGALALLVAAVIFIRRRRARSYMDHMPLPDEKYDSSKGQALRAPELAHTGTASSIFARLQGASNGGGDGHLTRSTNRSNTLFGAGPYSRPETVSTTRNNSQIPPPTPNPFEDPQRNKAYDMLNNRPRSTTLTDRGSWRENPFKNPESERFDPFGELKEKARKERLRYLQQVKREAELQRQMEQKEAMGLKPENMPWGHDNGYR